VFFLNKLKNGWKASQKIGLHIKNLNVLWLVTIVNKSADCQWCHLLLDFTKKC
jgi:hypothetical protein